jgi:hypothetical protein
MLVADYPVARLVGVLVAVPIVLLLLGAGFWWFRRRERR